jgi:large subunit ribosomal protein L22
MKAYLRSARIAPKKANLIAMMVRGMRVTDAITALERTHKKGARLVEELLKSAVANAEHNDKQHRTNLMIKTIVVNQGTAYQRGVPMARGRMRPMSKFMSHIEITLGIADGVHEEKMQKKQTKQKSQKKTVEKASPSSKNAVKETSNSQEKKEKKQSSASSDSSISSAS